MFINSLKNLSYGRVFNAGWLFGSPSWHSGSIPVKSSFETPFCVIFFLSDCIRQLFANPFRSRHNMNNEGQEIIIYPSCTWCTPGRVRLELADVSRDNLHDVQKVNVQRMAAAQLRFLGIFCREFISDAVEQLNI